jgi:uncharacterized membrane protein YeaQ/YmgE (transglycosylase-associated protein family)
LFAFYPGLMVSHDKSPETGKGNYMSLIWTLIIGLLVGMVAKLVMPGRDPGGFIITTLLGVAGAFVASMVGRAAGWYTEGEPASFLAAVLGAFLLLVIYRLFAGKSRTAV